MHVGAEKTEKRNSVKGWVVGVVKVLEVSQNRGIVALTFLSCEEGVETGVERLGWDLIMEGC